MALEEPYVTRGGVLFRFIGRRSQARFQFGPHNFQQRSITHVNGIRRLLRKGQVRYRHRLRFTTIRAFLRFARSTSATRGISALIQTRILSTRGLIRGRIKEGHSVRRPGQIIVIMDTQFDHRAMPFTLRMGQRIIRNYQLMSIHALFFRCRILLRHFRRHL